MIWEEGGKQFWNIRKCAEADKALYNSTDSKVKKDAEYKFNLFLVQTVQE